MEPLRILLVSSEIAPFAKTGGLADVAAGLGRYLGGQGHDVRLLMPAYGRIDADRFPFEPHPALQEMSLELGTHSFRCSVTTSPLPKSEVQVMFLRCPELYGRQEIYSSDSDEHLRFALLSRACLDVCQWLEWSPDVIHCNDWHTGLTPLYLKAGYGWDRLFEPTRTVLTIHNLGYQGVFSADTVPALGLEDQRQLLYQESLRAGTVGFLESGLLYADALTTVSETYAREIQTPEFGMGLEELLRARSDSLVGIVNGVDYEDWDPETDPLIPHNYSCDDRSGKDKDKRHLLEHFGLTHDPLVPVVGIISRLTVQKGFELLPDILPVLLREQSFQLVVLGSGEAKYEEYFQWLRDAFPDAVGFFCGYDNELAHRIEAGCDAFLMPSRYEPCGLNQMYSMKYGTVPIVRRTGGLADTVEPYDPATGEGTGFVFEAFSSEARHTAVVAALECYRDRPAWRRLVTNGMRRDFSWERQGRHYVDLYERLSSR